MALINCHECNTEAIDDQAPPCSYCGAPNKGNADTSGESRRRMFRALAAVIGFLCILVYYMYRDLM
jgi:hypothetical protein